MLKPITLVLGVSLKPSRYSHKAVQRLIASGIPTIAVGLRSGFIGETQVLSVKEAFAKSEKTDNQEGFETIDTITLYLSPKHQSGYVDFILKLKPKRVIFNPGTENMELVAILQKAGIYLSLIHI